MDAVFDWCVDVLVHYAGVFRITYKEINVWVFVIIWSMFTLALIILVVVQQARLQRLQNLLEEKES